MAKTWLAILAILTLAGRASGDNSCAVAGDTGDPQGNDCVSFLHLQLHAEAKWKEREEKMNASAGREKARADERAMLQDTQKGTALVLQMHGPMDDWHQYILDRYTEQLKGSEIKLGVLRDVSASPEDNKKDHNEFINSSVLSEQLSSSSFTFPSGIASVHRSLLHTHDGGTVVKVPLCEVSWDAAKNEFGREGFRDGVEPHQFHMPFQVLWWQFCAHDLSSPKRVWLVESDAFFTGHITNFINAFQNEDADLIARGFRVAGKHWWQWKHVLPGLPKEFKEVTTHDKVVKNLDLLPTLKDGLCNDGSHDDSGVIFRQDHVERISADLFKALNESIHAGVMLPSETWAPTVCAKLDSCSMFDFAPLLQLLREGKSSLISPVYCWKGDWSQRECDGCAFSAAWADKWVHPVKSTKQAAMDCCSSVSSLMRVAEHKNAEVQKPEYLEDAKMADTGRGVLRHPLHQVGRAAAAMQSIANEHSRKFSATSQ